MTQLTRYRGWTRFSVDCLLILCVAVLINMFYFPDFDYNRYPAVTNMTVFVREGATIVLEYYLLVGVVRRLAAKPFWLIVGLLSCYVLIYTFYDLTALLIDRHLDRYPNTTDTVYWFSQHGYWDRLLSYGTFIKLVGFTLFFAFLPLLLKVLLEVHRYRVNNANLQRLNTALELDYLRSQVNPHFLFNVLNNVYFLTEEQAPLAAQIIAQLSGIMRYTLYETSEAMVPLTKEITFIRNYIALEQLRAVQRVSIHTTMPEEVDSILQIAPLILITFIENAFKHGVHSTAQRSWVKITLTLEQSSLCLQVANSIPDSSAHSPGQGIGLSNVRKRLNMLYPDCHILKTNAVNSEYKTELRVDLTTEKPRSSLPKAIVASQERNI